MRRRAALWRVWGKRMKIEHLRSVGSTNDYIKQFIKNREDIAVFADVQTDGRGTKGRKFLSDIGGVYLSVLTFPKNLVAEESFRIMMHAAVSVCRTAEHFSVRPEIKWPNDVRAAGRKLAGILIENGISGGIIDYSIVGIGLNINNDLSSLDVAVSMKELGASPTVEEADNVLLENYLRPSTYEEYLTYVRFFGEKIDVIEGEKHYTAIARNILPDGRLEVEQDGCRRALSCAEIILNAGERR